MNTIIWRQINKFLSCFAWIFLHSTYAFPIPSLVSNVFFLSHLSLSNTKKKKKTLISEVGKTLSPKHIYMSDQIRTHFNIQVAWMREKTYREKVRNSHYTLSRERVERENLIEYDRYNVII